MTMADMKLVRLLAEKIGIKTVGELDEFKKRTGVKTNEQLIKRLALYVASETTFAEVKENKPFCN